MKINVMLVPLIPSDDPQTTAAPGDSITNDFEKVRRITQADPLEGFQTQPLERDDDVH